MNTSIPLKPYGFVQVCCVHLVKPQKTNVYLLLLSCAMVPLGTNILVLEFSFQELEFLMQCEI